LSHAVWSAESLAQERALKDEAEKRAHQYLEEREQELQLLQQTNNWLLKALHYRNAQESWELYYLSSSSIRAIPSDEEVVSLSQDFVLSCKGIVYTKHGFTKMLMGDSKLSRNVSED
jgi:predicted GTPase